MRRRDGIIVAVLALLCPAPAAMLAAEPALIVIGASGSVDGRLGRAALARIFLRKQTLWSGGARVQPVNLPASHSARIAFSQAVLGDPPDAFEDFWRDQYFHGVLPPHVVASEDAVVRFVASTPGAIGYVSTCPKTEGVVVVMTIGSAITCTH